MTVGHVGMKHPSLAGMVDAISIPMTREAMHARFTPKAEAFLGTCLQYALNRSVHETQAIETALLDPFTRVLIFDSSSLDVDPHHADVLPAAAVRPLLPTANSRSDTSSSTKNSAFSRSIQGPDLTMSIPHNYCQHRFKTEPLWPE